MPFDETLNTLSKYGGVFRWGSGLLGKSAIVVGPLVVGILVVAWNLHTDWAKLGAMLLAVGTFFCWYFPFLSFCDKHPANALLEGVQWSEHQRAMLATKGQTPELSGTVKDSQFGAVATETGTPPVEQTS